MGVERYYKILVVGGALLNSGCGGGPGIKTTSADAKSSKPPVVEATKAASKPTSTPAMPGDVSPKAPGAVDCTTVCKGEGTGRFCPSSTEGGRHMCCWLMPRPRHHCCQ